MVDPKARIYLEDIRSEIAEVRALTSRAAAATLASNWAMRRAVERALLIIAEASKRIAAEQKAARPEVPWRQIHDLGNLLRHEYRRVDPEILWSIVDEHLEPLDKAIAAILGEN